MARKRYSDPTMAGTILPPLPDIDGPPVKRPRMGRPPKHGILVAISSPPFAPRRFLVDAGTRTADASAWRYEFRASLPRVVVAALPTLVDMLARIASINALPPLPPLRLSTLPKLPRLRVSAKG